MRRSLATPARRRRVSLAGLIALLVLAGSAAAYWSAHASGSGSGKVGALGAPGTASASSPIGSTTVNVSWTAAPQVNGVTPSGYYVRRWNGASASVAGGSCGSAASPVLQTSCSDTGVADGTYTYSVVGVYRSWTAEGGRSGSVTVLRDVTPPTTTLTTSPSAPEGTNEWFKRSGVSFTLSAEDTQSGVASTKYTLDGGGTQTYSGAVTISTQGEHTVTYWSLDKAGNEETPRSAHIKLDSVPPSDAITVGSASHALLSGATLYFNPTTSGSFTLTDTVTDAASGPASATFPLVSASGWTHAAQTVNTPSAGPFASSTYTWTSGAGTPSGTQATPSSTDRAGNQSAGAALTFTPDSTAPSGGALIVNGTAASGPGTSSASSSTSFAIVRTDYSEAQGAGQSGLASSVLRIESETLSANACGAAAGAYASPTVITGSTQPTIATGYCYVYTLTGTDNVGNAASIKTTVKADASPPASPTVTLSGATGNTFISGSTAYIDPQAGKSGSFKAAASSSDAESGVSTIALPALSGFSAGGGALGSPFETTYTWAGAAAAAGAQSVTATNGAGGTSTNASAFTVTPDTTAPSGGSVSVPARVHALSVAVTFAAGNDSGSGINTASGEILRAEAAYTASSDSCGTFGSFAKVGSTGSSSPATDATVASGKCYEYEYKVSDNVGNAATYGPSEAVKVNTSGPALTGIASTNGNAILETGDTLTLTFSDPISSASVPTSGTLIQKKPGQGSGAMVSITGITSGSEGWNTGVSSGYQEKGTTAEYNETASVSGDTVKVTVGSKVSGSGTIAGATGTVTGTVNAAVKDVFENTASASAFSISAKLW